MNGTCESLQQSQNQSIYLRYHMGVFTPTLIPAKHKSQRNTLSSNTPEPPLCAAWAIIAKALNSTVSGGVCGAWCS